jgi:hypothetical protein
VGLNWADQRYFLGSRPRLQLRFSFNTVVHIAKNLEINKPVNVLPAGKVHFLSFVLENSTDQRIGHSHIQSPGLARQYVDVELSRESHSRFLTSFGMTSLNVS